MAAIIPVLLYNMQMIGAIMVLLLMAFGANTVLGVAQSSIVYDNFDSAILRHGLFKGAMILIGIFLITSVVSMIPPVFALYNITIISAEVLESISIVAVLAPIVYALIYYVQGGIQKISALFKAQLPTPEEQNNPYVS